MGKVRFLGWACSTDWRQQENCFSRHGYGSTFQHLQSNYFKQYRWSKDFRQTDKSRMGCLHWLWMLDGVILDMWLKEHLCTPDTELLALTFHPRCLPANATCDIITTIVAKGKNITLACIYEKRWRFQPHMTWLHVYLIYTATIKSGD